MSVPWICRNCSPCIVDRAFEYLAAVCNNIFNDMHVKPDALCLSTHNTSRSKSFGNWSKKRLLKKLLCRTCKMTNDAHFLKNATKNSMFLLKQKRFIITNRIRRIHYNCIISAFRNSLQKCNACNTKHTNIHNWDIKWKRWVEGELMRKWSIIYHHQHEEWREDPHTQQLREGKILWKPAKEDAGNSIQSKNRVGSSHLS